MNTEQLKQAAEGFEAVKARFPELEFSVEWRHDHSSLALRVLKDGWKSPGIVAIALDGREALMVVPSAASHSYFPEAERLTSRTPRVRFVPETPTGEETLGFAEAVAAMVEELARVRLGLEQAQRNAYKARSEIARALAEAAPAVLEKDSW